MRKILCMVTAAAALESFALEETVGNYTWSYEVNGDTATICKTEVSDSGRIDYTVAVSPRPKGHLAIPGTLGGKPVVRIGESALSLCNGLTSVSIPNSVVAIGRSAFLRCEKLANVSIPGSVVTIEDAAFMGCSCLASIAIPDSVKNIERHAFDGCQLSSVKIPNSVTNIGYYAFFDTLGSITIPESVETVGPSISREAVVYIRGADTRVAGGNGSIGYAPGAFCFVPRANSELLETLGLFYDYAELDVRFSQSEFYYHFGGFVETANNSESTIVSCKVRESDPTILDVVFKVESKKPTVKVRVLAFEDGERSFTKVVRPETFVDGTEPSDWDAVEANVEHTLSWKVSSDWAAKLAKVKFEVMTCEEGLLPLELVNIPASEKYGAMKISRNHISENQFFDALLWLYADKDPALELNDGCLRKSDGTTLVEGTTVVGNYSEYSSTEGRWMYPGREFIFSKMGYAVLDGDVLDYVNDELRLELQGADHGYRFAGE